MVPVSRTVAKKQGLRRYFTGKPCPKGHICERLTSDWSCIQCNRDKAQQWKADNKDKANAYLRDWHRRNPEKSKAIWDRRYQKSKTERRSREQVWHAANRDRMAAYRRTWKAKNPDALVAGAAQRRASKMQRSVAWADPRGIKWFYEQAKRLEALFGEKFHVDHVLPLCGEFVSGFHHQDNLQILTEEENLKKGNRFDPSDFPGVSACFP